MSTPQEIENFFNGGVANIGGNSQTDPNFYGNPNILSYLPEGTTYKDVTLESLGFGVDAVKYELLGMENDLTDPDTGKPYDDSVYSAAMYRSVGYAEKEFDIVIRPRFVSEKVDYHRADYDAFMFARLVQRPILHVENIQLYYNEQKIIGYPDEWIKVNNRAGQLEIQPSILMQGYSSVNNLQIYPISSYPMGLTPTPYQQNEFAPQMIGVNYFAGMIPQPEDSIGINMDYYPQPDLIAYVAKYAAIEILERWGRTPIGAGIASYNTSIDGISTGVNTTASAENSASSGEINNLMADMKHIRAGLMAYYGKPTIGIIG